MAPDPDRERPDPRLRALASTLRRLHEQPRPLVLPNAWDPVSAAAVERAGFPVVATTSAGVALTNGYRDHEHAPADEMLEAARRIAAAVSIPVTADLESGYGLPPDLLVERMLAAGVVGCNLEDSDHATGRLREARAQAERIAAVRDAASRRGVDVVLNARVDVFLHRRGESEAQLRDGIERARRYRDAGADCVYPILLLDRDAIARFVDAVACPVNVLAIGEALGVPALAAIGVRRVSFGGLLHRQALEAFEARLVEIASSA